MARDVDFNVVYQYEGTLKGFSKHLCERKNKPKQEMEKTAKNKPVCDLTSCPIDGAYLTLSKIGSLVILFHSPPGCSMGLWILWGGAYSLKSVTGTKKEDECITLCTNMGETDIVYGGNEKLRKALEDIKRRFNPEHVVVLSSCCAGIIGDDIDEVILSAREKLNLNVGWLDSSGFKSPYWPNGYDLAHQYLVDYVMEPLPVDDHLVNIIPYGNAARVDEQECGRLLTAIGLKVQYPLSVPHTTIKNIKKAPAAKVNAMMCMTFGWNFCKAMEKRFGTQYSGESHPIGTHFSKKWLLSIAKMFGKEKEAHALIEKEMKEIENDLKNLREQLKGKTIAVSAGHDKISSLLAMCFEFQMKVVYIGIITYDDLVMERIQEVVAMYDYDPKLLVNPQTFEEIPIVKGVKPNIYIGPAGLTPKNVMMQVPAISTHFNDFIGAYFGFKGLINLGREILNAINDPLPHYAPFNYLITGHEKVCGLEWYEKLSK